MSDIFKMIEDLDEDFKEKFMSNVPDNNKADFPPEREKVIELLTRENMTREQKQVMFATVQAIVNTFNKTLMKYMIPDGVKKIMVQLITIGFITDEHYIKVLKDRIK